MTSKRSVLLGLCLFLGPFLLGATAGQRGSANPARVLEPASTALSFVRKNVTYDLTQVQDPDLRVQILSALALGYAAADAGKPTIKKLIKGIEGDGRPKSIVFFSNSKEFYGKSRDSGVLDAATWSGPRGANDYISPVSKRSHVRVFANAHQPYWYLVNSVWHELLHTVSSFTHSQRTLQGEMPAKYVNDSRWYTTIHSLMNEFPRHVENPVNHTDEELYNPENSPWS